MANITQFSINNLHNRWSFDVPIKDNTLVIVGENGSGKTTLMNIMYYFLSGQWSRLAEYKFSSISVFFEDNEIKVTMEDIKGKDISEYDKLPEYMQRYLSMLKRKVNLEQLNDMDEIHYFCQKHDLPVSIALDYIGYEATPNTMAKLRKFKKELNQKLRAQVLYLPTYRRIEQELRFIFPYLDTDELLMHRKRRRSRPETNEYIELVEFGMRDVVEKIESRMNDLKEAVRQGLNKLTLRYLSEVIDAEYETINLDEIRHADQETIKAIIERIDPQLLEVQEKNRLEMIIGKIRAANLEPTAHDKVVAHFFIQLLHLQQEQEERESKIKKFINICNAYLYPTKKLVYDSKEYKISIQLEETSLSRDNKNIVAFKHLSSGEKQIVSLFSHLYLSEKGKFMVLIDEPELSLSVPWQKQFLVDIKKSGLCVGLIAVTHSPFIYENELEKYAHGLKEYRK